MRITTDESRKKLHKLGITFDEGVKYYSMISEISSVGVKNILRYLDSGDPLFNKVFKDAVKYIKMEHFLSAEYERVTINRGSILFGNIGIVPHYIYTSRMVYSKMDR